MANHGAAAAADMKVRKKKAPIEGKSPNRGKAKNITAATARPTAMAEASEPTRRRMSAISSSGRFRSFR